MYEHNPDCHVVFIVRNPTARAYSSYSMEHERGWMTRPFSELISLIENDNKEDLMYRIFIKLGLYSDYVKLLQSIFPAQNIHLILFEELQKKPADVCRRMFQLLGIDDSFVPDVTKIHNETVQTKSAFYSRFLLWLRQENNPVKRMAKAILPHRWFSSLGTKMVEANKSNRRVEPMDDATRAALNAFFEPYNAELERITGIDLSGWRK